jgi:hypothetical protein
MMDSEEREIYHHLKGLRDQFVPANAISRQAGGRRRFRESPDWAKPALLRMVERGILETDGSNSYRLKPMPPRGETKRWVSPQLAMLLKASGKQFEGLEDGADDTDTYYDRL